MPYLFIFLNVADAVLTAIGIHQGEKELNPLADLLMQQIGLLPALVLIKLATVSIVLAVATRVPLLLPIGCFAMAGALLWNISVLAS